MNKNTSDYFIRVKKTKSDKEKILDKLEGKEYPLASKVELTHLYRMTKDKSIKKLILETDWENEEVYYAGTLWKEKEKERRKNGIR